MARLIPASLLVLAVLCGAAPAAQTAAPAASLCSADASYEDWEQVLALGKPAIPELQKLLADASDIVRANAAVLLYRLGEANALDPLAALLESKSEEARRRAWDALLAFVGAPMDFDPAAAGPEREKALSAWKAWWKANRAQALSAPPMSALHGRTLAVDPGAKLVGISLAAWYGARKGMLLSVVRGAQPVCLLEIAMPGSGASVARIVDLSAQKPPRPGDRFFWISR